MTVTKSTTVCSMGMRDGVEISVTIYPTADPVAVCLFCHGGAFGVGDHTSDVGICEAESKSRSNRETNADS